LHTLNDGVNKLVSETQGYIVDHFLELEKHDCHKLHDVYALTLLLAVRSNLTTKHFLQEKIVVFAEQLYKA